MASNTTTTNATATGTTTGTTSMSTAVGYFAAPTNALQAYLYPSVALGFGILMTIFVCRFIQRRRLQRLMALQAAAGLRGDIALGALPDKPRIFDVTLEEARGTPYRSEKSDVYLWDEMKPVSANLAARKSTASPPPSPTPTIGRPTVSSRLSAFMRANVYFRALMPPASRTTPLTEPDGERPPAYDTLITGVMIVMPASTKSSKLTSVDGEPVLPEVVFGCVERDWNGMVV